mgnify:CR=1 FL=1|tara:strand:- start:584 stop:892 length:309 start_codon:yes stop_codon:yes gene_type:complete
MSRTGQEKLLSRLTTLIDKSNGSHGAFFINDGATHTAASGWNAITFLENTIFNTLTASNWSGNSTASETFPEGLTIYGNFTVIDLASGACIAYFATTDTTVS